MTRETTYYNPSLDKFWLFGLRKAQMLNNFFTSVFTKEDVTNIPIFESRSNGVMLENFEITEEIVVKHIKKTKCIQISRT